MGFCRVFKHEFKWGMRSSSMESGIVGVFGYE